MWQLEEEGMTTKATLSSSSIECLVMSSNFSYSPNKEIPKLKRLFVCWMLTGIKYCKLPPLVCKDSRQKEVKPMLWDKIESHSSHLCLLVSWSRISRMAVAPPQSPRPGWQPGTWEPGAARNFWTLITTETVPVTAEQISWSTQTSCDQTRSHKNYSLLATFWWAEAGAVIIPASDTEINNWGR